MDVLFEILERSDSITCAQNYKKSKDSPFEIMNETTYSFCLTFSDGSRYLTFDREMETLQIYDSEFQNNPAEDMQWESATGTEWQESKTEGLRYYVGKSYGDEIVGDENTSATAFSFCGNPW